MIAARCWVGLVNPASVEDPCSNPKSRLAPTMRSRKAKARHSVERLKVLEHIRGNKWKAEWIEPNAGLVDYVESGQLIAPWKEHKAVLREEADRQRIDEHNGRQG